MTQPAQPAPAAAAVPIGPPPAQMVPGTYPSSVTATPPPPSPEHENLIERFFHHGEQVAAALGADAKEILRGHSADLFELAAQLLRRPELEDMAPQIIQLVESAAKVAAVSLLQQQPEGPGRWSPMGAGGRGLLAFSGTLVIPA